MSIRFKLALAIDALIALTVLAAGAIVYNSDRALLQRQAKESRENILKSLASVARDNIAVDDHGTLISYTAGMKRIVKEVEVAYVTDGRYILAHTDRKMNPRQLPLSSDGGYGSVSGQLMVRKEARLQPLKGVSYSRRRVVVKGKAYDVVVGFSDQRVNDDIHAALDSVLASLLKAGALAVLAATLLAFWLSATLTRPISRLVKAFASTGGGDLDVKLPDSGRSDEIGTLNREFNRMVASLKELDEMKKDFVSSVTHELKSPLGAIESYLDLMAYEIGQAGSDPAACSVRIPKFLENITFIKQNSGRLLKFITDLLDASKIEKGKFEIARRPARIEPLIENAVKLFSERAKAAGVALRAETQGQLPQAMLDPERITQVIVNLVSNALKFTPGGGSVTVTASLAAPARGAGSGEKAAPRALRVVVADTGPGVPPEALGRLFGKFYQAPGSRGAVLGPKGTGLGLYIVKTIVEAHGGRAFAENAGGGARFGFDLPV